MKQVRKKILVILPNFHEYPRFINESLIELGYEVDMFFDFSTDVFFQRFKGSNSSIFKKYLNFFKRKILKRSSQVKYDQILVIKGCGLDNKFFKELKDIQSTAIFYMYQWDSIKNYNYLEFVNNFDKICTFDSLDCIYNTDLKINYIPLFFVTKNHNNFNKKYDVFFVGGVTLERYYWLEGVEKLLLKNNLNYYFYRYISPAQYINLLLKGKILNPLKLNFFSLNYKRMVALFNNSKCVIDIAHGLQSGLTMRTFDALANNCKIVTNNSFIKNEEFYHSKNILLFSLKDIDLIDSLSSFINEPFLEIHNIDSYNISEWLKKILS